MYNKKLLLTALKNLNQTKTPVKKKDIEESPLGKLKKGGAKKFSSNLGAKNVLYTKNQLYKKPKKNPLYKKPNYKNKIYDPYGMAFENGGESGCPEGFYNDPVQGCIPNDEHQKWLRDWYTNRKMSTPEGQEILNKIRPEVLERAKNFPPYTMTGELPENTAAAYDLKKNILELNKFLPEKKLEESKTHELGHYLTSGDKFLNLFNKQIAYVVDKNIITNPKKISTGNEEWDKELKKNFDEIVSPEEIYARIMTLRKDAGFDPSKRVTLKDLEDYFTKVKDSGSSLNSDIEDLKAVTKDKQAIVNLLNDMVSTPALQGDLKMAQFGGSQQPCPIGYEWNGIECIPNPFETRPSQRGAVYMDKDGNYQLDPAYQQYSQQKFDVSQSNKKAQDFNKMYAQSKNYKRLLKKQGYTPEEIKDRINSVMNINDFRYIDEGPSWVSANEDTGNEFISYNVTDRGDWPGFDQIAAHEWGHVGVDSGANPLKPKEREEFINRINKEQAGVTGNPDDLIHDMEPQENRADLLQLRQQLQEAGVFDSTKRKKFTKKDLNKYKKIMESSERSWDNMWNRMFRLYDDDSIIYFMNNVAKNNSDDDLQVAKYGLELELTEDEIKKYVDGGYVVEDISVPTLTRMNEGGTNPCPPDHYWNGEACVPTGRTFTAIDPNYIAKHPDEATRIQNEGVVGTAREASDIGKLRAEYREKNPMDIFLDEKKRQYLKRNKGLNKAAGVTMENFPEDVLQNFMSEYDYKTNNYAVNKLGKKEGWNPKRRGEWVDELTPGERDAVAESKYGSKLQPSYWSRSLAGVQELGNTLLPGQPFQYNIPGLTKKEQKEMRDSKLSALEILAPIDMPGAAIANLAKNTGLSTGSDYKEQPNVFAGEKMANVSDMEAMAFNPLTYAGMEAIPELGVNLVKGARNLSRGVGKNIAKGYEALATGNSPLPIAWKVEKPIIQPKSSDYITRKYTDAEIELLDKYGFGMSDLTPEDWVEFEKMTKSGVTDFSKGDYPITRVLDYYRTLPENQLIGNLKRGDILETPAEKNIRTWSVGFPPSARPRYANTTPTRLVIPSRYTKNLKNNFAAMPYDDPRSRFIYAPFGLEATKPFDIAEAALRGPRNVNAMKEAELMGNVPEGFKVIGTSNDGGFKNIIIKPLKRNRYNSNQSLLNELNVSNPATELPYDLEKNRNAAAIIEDLKYDRYLKINSPEGKRRIEELIANNPHMKNMTYEDVKQGFANMVNENAMQAAKEDEFVILNQKIKNLESSPNPDLAEIEKLKIQANNLEGEIVLKEMVMEEITHNARMRRDRPVAVSDPNTTKDNFDLNKDALPSDIWSVLGSPEFTVDDLSRIIPHEFGHYFQQGAKTNLDDMLSKISLKTNDSSLNSNLFSDEKGASNFFNKIMREGDPFQRMKKYWKQGGKGQEKTAFMEEVRADMLQRGMIEDLYQTITPELLKDHYLKYTAEVGNKYPLRIYEIMKNNAGNFKIMSNVLNKMPALVPIGAVGAGMMMQNNEENNIPKQKRGGIVSELSKKEIDRLTERGYIIEEVD